MSFFSNEDQQKFKILAYKNLLQTNTCVVTFTKKNGEDRTLVCTTNQELINHTLRRDPEATYEHKSTKKQNPDIQPVFDLEEESWRSFRWDSIQKFIVKDFSYAV